MHVGNSAVAQSINSTRGPDLIDFMIEAAGRMKINHGPHLAPGRILSMSALCCGIHHWLQLYLFDCESF